MQDPKEGAKKALDAYFNKQLKTNAPKPRRTNDKPEEHFVKSLLEYLRSKGFDLNVIEAKATFNPSQGRYVGSAVKAGFSDIVGNDNCGRSIYIEAKAPGRLSTIRLDQYDFLKRKILSNAFAVCVDSISLFNTIYLSFTEKTTFKDRQELLISYLPTPSALKNTDETNIFDP